MAAELDDELRYAAEAINRRGNGKPAAGPDRPSGREGDLPDPRAVQVYDFMALGEKTASALLQAAEEQVTQVQNMLEETRALADRIRADVQAKNAELASMNKRLKEFGSTILDAHRRFHEGTDGQSA